MSLKTIYPKSSYLTWSAIYYQIILEITGLLEYLYLDKSKNWKTVGHCFKSHWPRPT